jgi:3-deoxy-manno-octulosonate cytidylyltransferase (CMP-KDO synthetase)
MAETAADNQFTVIVPARYNSSRFPGKPLVEIHGKPMVQHVCERAAEANASRIIVATDDLRIANVVQGFGGEVCMTSCHHQSGTERLAEVSERLKLSDNEIIVNVQGDEPFIPATNIRQVAFNLAERSRYQMATLAAVVSETVDIDNPNAVKVVTDSDGKALYFSRASIPFDRDGHRQNNVSRSLQVMWRHIGIYAYRAGYIRQYVAYAASPLEAIEQLEQLRALWYGDAIHVALAHQAPPIGIDTPEDLQRLLDKTQH